MILTRYSIITPYSSFYLPSSSTSLSYTYNSSIRALLIPPQLQQFYSSYVEGHHDILCAYVSVRIDQVCIGGAGHQKLIPVGPTADGRNSVLYGWGVVGSYVSPHGMPLLPSRCQIVHILYAPKHIIHPVSRLYHSTLPIEASAIRNIPYRCN